MKDFHCCATCQHYRTEKHLSGNGRRTFCHRLGFDTKPSYKFDCWNPKPHIVELINKQKNE